MTWQAWAVIVIIIVAMTLFASEKLRIDLVALIVMAVLAVLGIVTPSEAFSGFSNEATITVAAMFALSIGIERSGVLEPLIHALVRIKKPWLLTLTIMVVIAPMGAFIKNIALVATFLPLALRICKRTKTSPSRVLMPMAYAAQMGGVATLIGTSSNLLANSMAQKYGLDAFKVFDFTALGAILAATGIAYMMTIGRWLLPHHIDADDSEDMAIGKYLTELTITSESPLVGQSIGDAKLGENHGIYPLELLRGERRMWAPRSQQLKVNDVLLVRGDWEKIEEFQRRANLTNPLQTRYVENANKPRILAEVLVAPASGAEGRRLATTTLAHRPDMAVIAIHRRGQVLRNKLRDVNLAVGDVLLVSVEANSISQLRASDAFIVLSERTNSHGTPRRAIAAIGIMIGVIVASGMNWLPIPVAAVGGAVLMALTGCFGRRDIYDAMDWKIIILLGAILPLGIAIEKTGLSKELVEGALGLLGHHGPLAALLLVYLLTALLTELMGHNPSVILMIGIAINVAHTIEVSPQPFVVAVAFAAATSFATPVGYPTNTMVYYAGGYRFTDFMKVGIPLIAIFCTLSMWLIPHFWPFYP